MGEAEGGGRARIPQSQTSAHEGRLDETEFVIRPSVAQRNNAMVDATTRDKDEGHSGADTILAAKHIVENDRPLINRQASISLRSQ